MKVHAIAGLPWPSQAGRSPEIASMNDIPLSLGSHRSGVSKLGILTLLSLSIWTGPAVAAGESQVASVDERLKADRLLTVDCLLPGGLL
jgi:hypothetical protein